VRSLLPDLRYAVRQLRASPAFTALVVLTLALGIGANTALFSLINGFLRPLPVPAPDRIVFLAAQTRGDETGMAFRFSYPAIQDLRRQADRFSGIFGFNTLLAGFSADGQVTQFLYAAVTGNYFSDLGVTPAAGRLFAPGEGESPGAALSVVLGYSFWQRRFGGNPGIVGRQVRLNGRAATVIGVVPKGFYGLFGGAEMDGYTPLVGHAFWGAPLENLLTDRTRRSLTVAGRLKPGVTLRQAQASVDVLAKNLEAQYPATDKDIGILLIPETLGRPQPFRFLADRVPAIRALVLVLCAMVLLLACMNLANILLVRASVRRREMAIRAALGCGRGRMVRQVLTESLLLGLMGGAAGLGLGKWGSVILARSIDLKTDFPIKLDFGFDWRVFVYALAAAVFTGIAIGVWPALRASQTDAGTVLHDGARGDSGGGGRQRVRAFLVVGQVAGSLVLLVVAGLFARSLQRAQQLDLGFDQGRLLNARLDPSQLGYTRQKTIDFYRELERRARAIPGVESASLAFNVPLGYINDATRVFPEGRASIPGEQPPVVGYNSVGTDYFATMGIPIVSGRPIVQSDNESAPLAAVVNQTMARRFWPGRDPIGRRFRTSSPSGPLWQIVGVARDGKYMVVFENPLPYFYLPSAQWFSYMRVVQLRTTVPPDSLRLRLEREIQALDPEMPIADLQPMRQALAGGMGFMMFRVGAIQAGAMGLLGLALAVIGVYGVVSYGAAQRTREIGIRMALGAEPGHVRALVLGQGLLLVIAGVAVGLAAASATARFAARYVLLAGTVEAWTIAAITALLAAIALLACYLPARRAMRVDPLVALRHE
jgi:predicted permease